jgi:transposase
VTSLVGLTAPLRRGEKSRLLARHILGSVKGPDVVRFLRYLHARLKRPIWAVLDRLSAHRCAQVKRLLALHPRDYHLVLLPPYAPDLNPEEQCNAVVKRAMLNAVPDSIEEMRSMARREFRRLQRRHDTLRAFFSHAGLSLHSTG